VVTLPTLPNLDGLIGLARQDGVDVRPTLVRVLTDLYVQKRVHTREEEHRYTELVLWLLASVDVPTRAAVARKLATYAHAPRLVARRLARDVFEVAEPVLKLSPCLTSDDLLAIIREFGPRYAEAIGERERGEEQTDAAAAPVGAEAIGVELPVAATASVETTAEDACDQAAAARGLAPLPDKRPRVTIGAYFLSANATERRLLLVNLQDGARSPSEQTLATATEEAVGALEAAALDRRPDDFARGLERFLRVSSATAQTIVVDDDGEPLVVAAKALGMRSEVFLRVLLFLNPIIGHSVERVFDLANLYDQLSAEAALHIVSSWQHARAGERRTGRHQPLHFDDETRAARRTFAEHGRRPAPTAEERRALTASDERRAAQRTT
jgi:uncharacterized protein (DUF2336 family)